MPSITLGQLRENAKAVATFSSYEEVFDMIDDLIANGNNDVTAAMIDGINAAFLDEWAVKN